MISRGWRNSFSRAQLIVVALAVTLITVSGWAAFELKLAGAIGDAEEQSQRRLALFDRTLEAIIERFRYLPSSIALAAEAQAILTDRANPALRERANGFLSRLNDSSGAGELFIMAADGNVVAASNWWAYDSFVGEDLGYRPYFTEAMADGDAKFYAVGTVTGVAGYFLARRIDGPDGPLGVAVTKINLGEIEATWWRSGELLVIVDANDVAILSTRPDWRYRPVRTISPGELKRIEAERRYGETSFSSEPIAADVWPSRGARFAFIASTDQETAGLFLLDEKRLPTHQWRILSFTPTVPLFRDAWTAAAAAALAAAALLLIVALLVQRQRVVRQRLAEHESLERRVAERTQELHITNEVLRAEIAERIRAEKAQRDAQHGLVQAAKMASLGQTLAGVAHEISQPVAALTTHLASARLVASRSKDNEVAPIIATMEKVVDRLGALTGHLKTFARKETQVAMQCELAPVIANALDLLDHKLRTVGIDVDYRRPAGRILVSGNPVHLEQVLINLLSNAADAMEGRPIRILSIRVREMAQSVCIDVIDTGPGIAPSELPSVFDPFYSTKEPGRGLGLGLSISYSLVRDTGGTLTANSVPGQGSTFTVTLPLANQPALSLESFA